MDKYKLNQIDNKIISIIPCDKSLYNGIINYLELYKNNKITSNQFYELYLLYPDNILALGETKDVTDEWIEQYLYWKKCTRKSINGIVKYKTFNLV
jgi:hypothetical protein